MGSSWRRNVGSVRSFISNSMGGLKGGNNLASWAVAFTLAYFLWVKPDRDLKKEQEARAAAVRATAFEPSRSIGTRKPMLDPGENEMIYGKGEQTDNPKD